MHAHYPPVPRGRRYAHRRAGLGTLSATHALFLVYGKVISVVLMLFRHRAEKTDVLAESAVNAFFLIDTIRHFLPRHIQVGINRQKYFTTPPTPCPVAIFVLAQRLCILFFIRDFSLGNYVFRPSVGFRRTKPVFRRLRARYILAREKLTPRLCNPLAFRTCPHGGITDNPQHGRQVENLSVLAMEKPAVSGGFFWRERREFIRTQIFIIGSLFSRLPLHFLYHFLRNSILRIVFGKVICYR